MVEDYIHFEVYDIRNLAVWDKPTLVDMRMYGVVNDVAVEKVTTLVAPGSINTYNELSEHIFNCVLIPYYNTLMTEQEVAALQVG